MGVRNYGFYFYSKDAIPAKKPKRPESEANGRMEQHYSFLFLATLFKGETGIPCYGLQQRCCTIQSVTTCQEIVELPLSQLTKDVNCHSVFK